MTTMQPHAPLVASRGNDIGPWPRYVNAAAGAWLFLSAFLWTHLPAQRTNSWIVGMLVFAAAIAGMNIPRARFANAILAIWLFVSAVFMGSYRYTAWNNAIVALVVFAFALVPTGGMPRTARRLD